MHRALLAAAVSAILATAQSATAQEDPAPRELRLAFWNMEHFVDANDDPYVDSDLENTTGRDDAELAKMAEVISELNADILVASEIEGEAWGRDYALRHLPELGYTRIVGARDESWYQNIVVFSRVPLGPIVTLKAAESTDGKGGNQFFLNGRMMIVEVRPSEDYTFLLGCVHLKAGAKDEDRATRTGQIELLKREAARYLKVTPGGNFLVFGDMNFAPENPEFQAITKTGFPFVNPFEEWGFPPTHPAEYPTRHIDSIYVNEAMAPEIVPASAAVAKPFELFEMSKMSDHLPIVVTIQAREAEAASE
ncbi:MAG: endonuclease/exonuclease/phosphatase family protein [Candidatus Sumerlaeia bacterium]|nr:endonuclease/exonuclease/phosphatase family protein [Candidatus Sumerlaeia bacterium]